MATHIMNRIDMPTSTGPNQPVEAIARFNAAGLHVQFILTCLVLFVLAILNTSAVHYRMAEQEGIADTMSVAGRLRMLSQKLVVETLLFPQDPTIHHDVIKTLIVQFETGLDAIENGGLAYGYQVKRLPGSLAHSLERVHRHWEIFRDKLRLLPRSSNPASVVTDPTSIVRDANETLSSLESLIADATSATRTHEQQTHLILSGLFFTDLLCLLGAYLLIRCRILDPIRHFAQVAEQLGLGHYHLRIDHQSLDEIGQLGVAVNRMADRIEQDISRFAEEATRQHELWLSARKLAEAVEHSPVSVLITDHVGRIEYANSRFTEISGYAIEDVKGQTPAIFKSGHTPISVFSDLWQTITAGEPWTGELLNRKKNGELFWEATRIAPLRNKHGDITHFVCVKSDITARKAADKALRLRQCALNASSNGIAMIDAETQPPMVLYVNPAFTRITGYGEDEVAGRFAHTVLGFTDYASFQAQVLLSLAHTDEHIWVVHTQRKDGQVFWCEYALTTVKDEKGYSTHYVAALSDVTERIDYERRLAHQATHDALTGLANRALLADRIGQAISHANRYSQVMAVILIDLDHFKYVNDTLGHAVGDRLLQATASRLTDCVREIDTVARMGGDEFVVILTQIADAQECEVALQRIVTAIAAPYRLEGHEAHVSCSVGACFYPKDGQNADELLRHADTAMYQAKELGRNNFQFYQPVMNERFTQRVSMESQLRRALDRDELILHYQPQVDLRRGVVTGLEALVRWQHPELGLVPPGKFIPLAEEIGLIAPIGAWVLQTACSQASAWAKTGLPTLRMAVNLSVHQLRPRKLVTLIEDILTTTHMRPEYLELEITESVVVHDPETVIRLLQHLREKGLRIALDDFGTGYSSLNYLKRLPIDVLKIDQSFVRGIDTDRHDAALTRTVIGLADCLELETIAEGVEVEAQAELLRDWGCQEAQGFLFQRPMVAEDITRLLCTSLEATAHGDEVRL